MRKITFVFIAASVWLGGCISVGTYERQMQKYRDAEAEQKRLSARAAVLEKENADLRGQLNEKAEEREQLEQKITDVRNTYDDLIQTLKDDIAEGSVAVEERDGNLAISVANQVLFRSGQAALQKQGVSILNRVAKILKDVEGREFRVEGHTDNVPISGALKSKYGSNWELSSARASTVVRALQEKGVDPAKLTVVGYAEFKPVGDNKTVAGRRMNRRVEILLAPLVPEKE